jgi:hypothetical protein
MTVDELVVELKLDPTNFTQNEKQALAAFKKMNEDFEKQQQEAAKRTEEEWQRRQQNLESINKKAEFSFKDLSNAAEGLFGALAGAGMAAFARDTMTSVAATGRMATNIGEATGELSAFGRMIERNGGSAETAMGTMKGLSDQLTRLKTLGQGSDDLFMFLGTIDSQEKDGPLETFMRFAEWAEKNKNNPQLVNMVGQQGGLDQGAINEALKGHTQVMKDFAEASKGAIDPAQVTALTQLQASWIGLDQAIEKTGRDIVTDFAPTITSVMSGTTAWIEHNQKLADSLGKVLTAIVGLSALKPAAWLLRVLGLGSLANPATAAVAVSAGAAAGITHYVMPADRANSWNEAYPTLGKIDAFFGLGGGAPDSAGAKSGGAAAIGGTTPGAAGQRASAAEREAWIRAKSAELRISPEVAMWVSKHEGFGSFKSTIPGEQSFGDFQLHITPGGRGQAVGDEFQKQTGLDPSDPANERRSDEFALEWVKRHGWGDFHGAANSGIGPQQGIGDITVNVQTDSKDPHTHGRIVANEIKGRLSSGITTQANTGLN